jgi:Ca2+/Na+ antiporter
MADTDEKIFKYRKIFSTIILSCILMCCTLITLLLIFHINYWFNLAMIIFLLVVGILLVYLFQFYFRIPYVTTTKRKIAIAYPLKTIKFNIEDIDEIHKESITNILIFYEDKNDYDKSSSIFLRNLENEDQIELGKYLDQIILNVGA